MARFIPVDGSVGPEESLHGLLARICGLVSFDYLGDGQVLLSQLDVTKVNAAATELVGGKVIYGHAVLYNDAEGFN